MSFSNFFQGNIIDPVSFMQVVRKQCSIYQNWNDSERMVLRIENIHSNIFLNAIRNFLSPVSVKTELDIPTSQFKFSSLGSINLCFRKNFFDFFKKLFPCIIFSNSSAMPNSIGSYQGQKSKAMFLLFGKNSKAACSSKHLPKVVEQKECLYIFRLFSKERTPFGRNNDK